ncbi:MAG: hypothetical protein COV46_01675 [Deltaproteobacteria bacterium CG11_big_fil_rev_8_21_14_0_20_49_13]|nr:MAG: hypothetical protein COV46_01675 [Deltaproteobacteria bacterium CG11_big_fil_rev_8_21_14_0_20_49_13]
MLRIKTLILILPFVLLSFTVSAYFDKGADPRYLNFLKAYNEFVKQYADVSWPKVPSGKKTGEGDTDPRVPILRERLHGEGLLKKPASGDVFDHELSQALMEFQGRNGILDDGVLGKFTVTQLNISPQERICQMRIGLKRLSDILPRISSDRYVVVNIPDYMARLYINGNVEWESRAIVGRLDRKTPPLNDEIEYIVFSPKWRVPVKIAVEDKIPEIQKDPDFLKKMGMKVYARENGELIETDPATIDWGELNKDNFDYLIVQDAGGGNALGRIKFMFPNKDDVYLHDTPTKKLFESMTRTFSSGCIRIQRPVELAEIVLKDKEGWDRERIEKEMHRKNERFLNLDEHIPISVVYLTSWVDDDGDLEFRRDIYSYDRQMKRGLCADLNVK